MANARVRMNAFCKDSSRHYSETVNVSSLDMFVAEEKKFGSDVPFSRFYYEHEVLESDDEMLEMQLEKYID
jgi:hypothetical protein